MCVAIVDESSCVSVGDIVIRSTAATTIATFLLLLLRAQITVGRMRCWHKATQSYISATSDVGEH